MAAERLALLRDPVLRGDGVARGDGRPVLLVPGFLAGDDSLGLMTRWLRRTGHQTRSAGIRSNVACSAAWGSPASSAASAATATAAR